MRKIGQNFALILLLLISFNAPVSAITAEEKLADPVLETRARALSQQLRCVVCQNQSIDDSDAPLARDLRQIVREQLIDGRSDTEIIDYLQDTYGDYVLLNPPHALHTLVLWYAPVAIVVFAILFLLVSRRKRHQEPNPTPSPSHDEPINTTEQTGKISTPWVMVMLAVMLGMSFGVYQFVGRPDLAPQPLAERGEEIQQRLSAENVQRQEFLAAQNQTRLQPQDPENWFNLGIAAARIGNFTEAVRAYEAALEIDANNLSRLYLAEAVTRAADGQVTLKARALLDTVLTDEPQNPFALYLKGLGQYQDQLYSLAVATWQQSLQFSPPRAPWREAMVNFIASAAELGDFTMPDLPNSIGEAEILAMVEGLAARLQDNPDDSEGWLRLGRSYDVLQRPEEAEKAYYRATQAAPETPEIQLQYLEWLLARDLTAEKIAHAAEVLDRLQNMQKHQSEYLFFAGHLAKIRGDDEGKKRHWGALLELLPPDSPVSDTLKAELEN